MRYYRILYHLKNYGDLGGCLTPSSSGASFFVWQRRGQNASDLWWTAWEGYRRPLSPSRLPLRGHFHRERDVLVRGRPSLISIILQIIRKPNIKSLIVKDGVRLGLHQFNLRHRSLAAPYCHNLFRNITCSEHPCYLLKRIISENCSTSFY